METFTETFPEYWVVKPQQDIRKFKKYIEPYLNKLTNQNREWAVYRYVGYDGCASNNGVHGVKITSDLFNNPELILIDKAIRLIKSRENKPQKEISSKVIKDMIYYALTNRDKNVDPLIQADDIFNEFIQML